MPVVAVLDACVLYPFLVRDVLLRLAEADVYAPVWSDEILAELERNLTTNASVDGTRVRTLLSSAFPAAAADSWRTHMHEVPVAVHEKDRHVVAAAIDREAAFVVTYNLPDFAAPSLERLGIGVETADGFLSERFLERPSAVIEVLRAQLQELSKPALRPEMLAEVLPGLAALVGPYL